MSRRRNEPSATAGYADEDPVNTPYCSVGRDETTV